MFYFYVLKSEKDGSYYVGYTKDLKDRLNRHNLSQSISTRARIPWEVIYFEKFNNKIGAIRRERQVKKGKSRKYIERLIKRGMAQFGLEHMVWDHGVVGSSPTPPI